MPLAGQQRLQKSLVVIEAPSGLIFIEAPHIYFCLAHCVVNGCFALSYLFFESYFFHYTSFFGYYSPLSTFYNFDVNFLEDSEINVFHVYFVVLKFHVRLLLPLDDPLAHVHTATIHYCARNHDVLLYYR